MAKITKIDFSKYFPSKLSNDMIEWKDIVLFSPRRGSGKSNLMLHYWMKCDDVVPMKVEVEMYA